MYVLKSFALVYCFFCAQILLYCYLLRYSILFQLYPKDPLPKTVCLDCCAKLDQCSDFLETTSQAQVTLHMIFPGAKKEEEENTEEHRPKSEHEPDHDSSSFLEEVREYFSNVTHLFG